MDDNLCIKQKKIQMKKSTKSTFISTVASV